MRRPRVGAHDGPMFNSYEMTRALIAERQGTLRHEARQHRLGRSSRRARRTTTEARSVRPTPQTDPLPAATSPLEERVAA